MGCVRRPQRHRPLKTRRIPKLTVSAPWVPRGTDDIYVGHIFVYCRGVPWSPCSSGYCSAGSHAVKIPDRGTHGNLHRDVDRCASLALSELVDNLRRSPSMTTIQMVLENSWGVKSTDSPPLVPFPKGISSELERAVVGQEAQ